MWMNWLFKEILLFPHERDFLFRVPYPITLYCAWPDTPLIGFYNSLRMETAARQDNG